MKDKIITLTEQTRWATLKGKQKALFYNPGNALKRKYILKCLMDYMSKRSSRNNMLKLLDVGSGVGDLALDFFLEGGCANYILLDVDKRALEEARATLKFFNVELILADAQNLPFRSEAFDVVICSEVLEHLQDDVKALREMTRALQEQGIMIISIPLYEDLDEVHVRSYDHNKFLTLINSINLKIKKLHYACRTIHIIGTLLRKIFRRRGMGEREGIIYARFPLITKVLLAILRPIDSILAGKCRFPKLLHFMNKATLIAVLTKKEA